VLPFHQCLPVFHDLQDMYDKALGCISKLPKPADNILRLPVPLLGPASLHALVLPLMEGRPGYELQAGLRLGVFTCQ